MPDMPVGQQIFMALWMLPILGLPLIVFADLYYGVTFLLIPVDGAIYRDQHPFWYWVIEAIQVATLASVFTRYFPPLWAIVRTFT